jgi:hypothetical protein
LIATTEDDYADTVAPRLDWLGADDTRWWTMEGIKRDEDLRPLCLDRDLERIERTIKQRGAKLVVFDPFSGFLDHTNPTRDTEVRRVVAPLSQIAKRTGAAIIILTHIKKGAEDVALYRALNSIALVAQARSALAFAQDPDDENRRVIVPIKGNLSGRADPVGFKIQPVAGTKKAVVEFDDEPVSLTWQTVFSGAGAAAGGDSEGDRAWAVQEAKEFLIAALDEAGGKCPKKQLEEDAKVLNNISETTLKRAKAALKLGHHYEGRVMFWDLPAGDGTATGSTAHGTDSVDPVDPVGPVAADDDADAVVEVTL